MYNSWNIFSSNHEAYFHHCYNGSKQCLTCVQCPLLLNSLRPRQMDAISQTTFSNAFSWMKMFEFRLKFHWVKFLAKGPINNIPAMVQIMAWRRPGDKPLSEPMMVGSPTHICVTRPQWVNGLASFLLYIILKIISAMFVRCICEKKSCHYANVYLVICCIVIHF